MRVFNDCAYNKPWQVMSKLCESDIVQLKKIVLRYLQGEAIDVVKVRLQTMSSSLNQSTSVLYKKISINPNDPYLKTIFTTLNEEDEQRTRQVLKRSKNFYQLLSHLCHNKHKHLELLLHLIGKTTPPKNWAVIFSLGALLSAAVGVFFHFNKLYFEQLITWATKTFPKSIHWLGKTFSILRNIPALGIIYNSFEILYDCYKTFSSAIFLSKHRLSALGFNILRSSLSIAAYTLSFLSGGTLALPIASLFVLSASIDVTRGFYVLYHCRKDLKALAKPDPKLSSWQQQADFIRKQCHLERSLKSVWVKLGTAALATIAVFIWSFSPPSLVITASCLTFLCLISLAKQSFVKSIKRSYANHLQRQLSLLNSPPKLNANPSNQQQLAKILKQEKQIKKLQLEIKKTNSAKTNISKRSTLPHLSHRYNITFWKGENHKEQDETLQRSISMPNLLTFKK